MTENNNKQTNNYFDNIIGIEKTKKQLSFYIDNFKSSGLFPNMLFSAARGMGKTHLARKVSNSMGRRHVEVNSSSVKTLDDFFEIYNLYLSAGNANIFLDESESLGEEVSLALLTILNPTSEHSTKYTHKGIDYIFDFRTISFMAASTDIQKMHHALIDRLCLITIEDYTLEDLTQIINLHLKDYKIENGLLNNVARIVRNNPRNAVRLSTDLLSFLSRKTEKTFTFSDWTRFFKELGLYDLGLNSLEIKLLKLLKQYPNSSLTRISTMLNHTTDSVRRQIEQYPMKLGLFTVRPATGRALTNQGIDYLNKLQEIES